MALADKYGPYEDECIKLAGLASKAVDFAKTGVPVSQADIPVIEEYPDYMGKVRYNHRFHIQPDVWCTCAGFQIGQDLQEAGYQFV